MAAFSCCAAVRFSLSFWAAAQVLFRFGAVSRERAEMTAKPGISPRRIKRLLNLSQFSFGAAFARAPTLNWLVKSENPAKPIKRTLN
jgi:hypothetical protein